METSASLVDGIVNNAPFHYTSIRCRLKSFTSCAFSDRLDAPDFVINWIEVRAVRWPKIWKFIYGSLTLLHFRTAGRQRTMHGM